LAVGTQFGPFTLLRKLARGGMADIFLARRRTDQEDELCVIKMMLPKSLRNPQALKLFLGEARLASQLDHENIVRILKLDRVDDYYFIAMEYVPGETIFHLIHQAAHARRPIQPLEAAAIVHQAAAGLANAHALTDKDGAPLNIVHRDISPSNIILSYDGIVKILDFGIAAAKTRTAGFPEGKALGKFSYMSPEQCTGEKVDRRSDLFSLGIVFWELSTGAALFHGADKRAIVASISSGYTPRPRSVNLNIPEPLEEIIMRSLATSPKSRFQSGWEMAEAIEKACDGRLPSREDLSEMMIELFSKRRARLSRIGDVGEEIELETLLFDDLDAAPPARKEEKKKRKLTVLSRGTIILLIVASLLLIGAVGLRVYLSRDHPQKPDGLPVNSEVAEGVIDVDSSPRGAIISINGEETDKKTPASISGVPLDADIEVGLSRKGYETWFGKVRLEENSQRRIYAVLKASGRHPQPKK